MMLDRGYSREFSDLITKNLNTDFTATRMIGYLSHYSCLPEGEVVDGMLAILSDRDRIMRKKEAEVTVSFVDMACIRGQYGDLLLILSRRGLWEKGYPIGYPFLSKRETGIEPATPSLARRCSTAEPLAQTYCVPSNK